MEKYYCPMHPEVTPKKPGNCPECGMRFVQKGKDRAMIFFRKTLEKL